MTYTLSTFGADLEFETFDASLALSVDAIPGTNKYIIAYNRSGSARARVYEYNESTGDISALGSSHLAFATNISNSIDVVAIDDSNAIIFYSGTGTSDDGFCVLISIDGSYNLSTNGSPLEFDTSNGTYIKAILWDSTHILASWSGSGDAGFVAIFTVNTGAGTITKNTQLEYDTSTGYLGSLVKVASGFGAILYSGAASSPYIKALDINESTWAVTSGGSSVLVRSGADVTTKYIQLCGTYSGDYVILAIYSDVSSDLVRLRTYLLTSGGAFSARGSEVTITGSQTGSGGACFSRIDDTNILICARMPAANPSGFIATVNISDGSISISDGVEINSNTSYLYSDLAGFGNGIYANAFSGASSDGFTNTLKVVEETTSAGSFFYFM